MEGFKKDSIKVSKTSTGKYSAEVKIRDDDLQDPERQDKVIQAINDIYIKLKQKFPL